ncbi:MAG: translocation/assembly module TamB domain-containing protein, partial [Gammaproteobacteria bacterium]|nr:translocation/assembly module TamB domain-containing protein [Gammaproteobacteria bacterium]
SDKSLNKIEFIHDISLKNQLNSISLLTQANVKDLTIKDPVVQQNYQAIIGSRLTLLSKIYLHQFKYLTIDSFEIDGYETSVYAQGKVNLENSQIDLQIEHSLDDLSFIKGAEGSLEQQIKINGNYTKPKIQFHSNIDDASWQSYQFDQIELDSELIELSENKNKVNLVLIHAEQKLQASMNYQLYDGILLLSELKLSAMNNDFEHTNIQGNIQFQFDNSLVKGQLKGQFLSLDELNYLHHQKDLFGNGEFIVKLASVQKQQEVILNILFPEISFQQWKVGDLDVDVNTVLDKQLDAKLKLSSLYEDNLLRLSQGNINISGDFENFSSNIKIKSIWGVDQLNTNFIAKVPKSQNESDSHLFVIDSFMANYQEEHIVIESPLTISYLDSDNWKINAAKWSWGNSSFDFNASAQKQQIKAKATIQSFDLSKLRKLDQYLDEFSEIEGILDFNLNISGAMNQPEIDVLLAAENFKLNQQMQEIIDKNQLKVLLSYKNEKLSGELNGEIFSQHSNANTPMQMPIQGKFELPMKLKLSPFVVSGIDGDINTSSIKANFKSHLKLSQFQQWVILDQQNLDGLLVSHLDIKGSILQPKINGALNFQDVFYENGFTGTVLKDVNGNITIQDNQIKIDNLSAHDKFKGTINLTGNVDLANQHSLNYSGNIHLSDFKLLDNDEQQLVSSGQIDIIGDHQRGKVTGKISIDSGEFFLPEEIPVDAPILEITKDGSDIQEESSTKYPIDVNLQVNVKPQLYVRGRGLDSQWTGDLSVKGKIPKPDIVGQLKVNRGKIDFLTKRFNSRRGEINFYGGWPVNPQLDFEFESTANDIAAILNLSGDTKKIKFNLSSEPLIPKDEILSQLLFGKDKQSISAVQALQLVSAIKTLTTGGSGFMDNTRQKLGIDSLDIGGDSVKAGKHINERVYMEVEQDLTSGDSAITVEIEVKKNISVESKIDQSSSTGIGVNWKYDY